MLNNLYKDHYELCAFKLINGFCLSFSFYFFLRDESDTDNYFFKQNVTHQTVIKQQCATFKEIRGQNDVDRQVGKGVWRLKFSASD